MVVIDEMAILFDRDKSVIGKHIRNIFKEEELFKESVWAKFAYTASDAYKEGVSATIYTQRISSQLQLDLEKHNAQYPAIDIRTYKRSHDRFLLIDGLGVYHIGASLKDLGKKMFAFSKLNESADMILQLVVDGKNSH